ncbi:MAG: GAF domain-containing protein [Deltaproteobacteria bacterium]|nr:GAF domain-containing protein [Deltaproteobacteria bacterium]
MNEQSAAINRETRELALLWEVSRLLGQSMDLAKIGAPILRALDKNMGMSRGFFTLLNRETGDIVIEASHGFSEAQISRGRYRIGEGVVGKVVETGRPMVVPRVSEEPLFLDRTGARKNLDKKDISFICVPVRVQSEIIGTLSADRIFDESVSLNEDLRLLTIIASMLAQAVKYRQQAEEAQELLSREHERITREKSKSTERATMGLKSLDAVIDGLRMGDNVVWQVDHIDEYRHFAAFFVQRALEEGKRIVYMRFADHKPIIDPSDAVKVYTLDAAEGFESFSSEVYNIATREGKGVYYVFDCLSNLLSAWATDLMIGNFFVITCPYLYELDTIAYFAIVKDSHSFQTVARIRETTQVLLDVLSMGGYYYVHPLKVWRRYSPTMFLPHKKEEDRFVPIIDSIDAAKLYADISRLKSERMERRLDYWDRLFLEAEELLEKPWESERQQEMIDQICRIMMTREARMSILVKEYFSLEDLLDIRKRLVGTGYIGGKSAGMLLARMILDKDRLTNWRQHLEPHDSFYLGSDVYYTYLVQNGWWRLRMKQKATEGYFHAAAVLREKMQHGTFPEEIREQFVRMLDYFGQSPIIVRSSSLLEDSFGNAFAGKYESIFLVNQGTPEERYEQFETAVRKIYASTMNENALSYRLQRGLQDADEQMPLLVQRVSGAYHTHYFFPDAAGVGASYNTFVWNKDMDPRAGMLRIVFGLGTRAVNRVEGDYPRIVALDRPLVRPHAGMEDTRKYSQKDADVLDLSDNVLKTIPLTNLLGEHLDVKIDRIAVRDYETDRRIKELGIKNQEAWIVTFDDFLSKTPFNDVMRNMMRKLETIYEYPVDIEFTVNFPDASDFRINLVQCRPLQTIGLERRVELPEHVDADRIVIESEGGFFGGSISKPLQRIVVVDPAAYTKLPLTQKYDVARLVGRLNRQIVDREKLSVMLMGPGRWGSTTPSLGVPVSFAEINNMTVLAEIAYSDGNLMPELSYGTHFFQDLVETRIFYLALFPGEASVIFNEKWLAALPNHLNELLPDYSRYEHVVKVCEVTDHDCIIMADIVQQKVICFLRSTRR